MSFCYFKNKNEVIAIVDFIPEANAFVKIETWENLEAAPLTIKNAESKKHLNALKELNNWYQNRGIPQYRDELDDLLLKLNIDNVKELKRNSYALSLSDQYWFHSIEDELEWKDVNFFTNDFDYLEFVNAVFSSSSSVSELLSNSPNYSTDGMVKKAWIIEKDGIRALLKGGYKKSCQEPYNELLASDICNALDMEHTTYYLKKVGDQIVSACPSFIDENTELIPAADIFFLEKKSNQKNDYNYYISILEEKGIKNAREQMENMLVLDYIMLNEDRHLRNFGIIRNVETLEWIKVAPIYDTGQSLLSQTDYFNMNFNSGYGKFFTNVQVPFDKIIKNVDNLERFNFSNLDGVVDKWKSQIVKWDKERQISSERIDRVVEGVKLRIKKISELQRTKEKQHDNSFRNFER